MDPPHWSKEQKTPSVPAHPGQFLPRPQRSQLRCIVSKMAWSSSQREGGFALKFVRVFSFAADMRRRPPVRESSLPEESLMDRFEMMTCNSEQDVHRAAGWEKSLNLCHRLEATHLAFLFPGVLMGDLSSVVEVRRSISASVTRTRHCLAPVAQGHRPGDGVYHGLSTGPSPDVGGFQLEVPLG